MMSRSIASRPKGCFTSLLVLLLIAGVTKAQDFKVKLIRPEKVGDQFASSVTAKLSETTITQKNGEETERKTETFTAACQGTVKVLAVDDKTGLATRIRYQVDSMTKNNRELYPEGTVIIAKRSGTETDFEIDGDRPDEEHVAVLNALLGEGRSSAVISATESGGTNQVHQVGSSWPISVGSVPTGFYDGTTAVTTDDVKGEIKLVSVKKVDGQDVMVVKSTLTADGFKKDVPGGWSFSDGKMNSEVTEVVPVDDSLPATSSSAKLTVSVTMTPPIGATKTIVTMKAERRSRRDPIEQ